MLGTGVVFEVGCREWLGRYAPPGRFPDSERLGSWWSRNGRIEIDIVGTSKDRYDLLASCKWSQKAKTSALGDLLAARDHLGGRAAYAALIIFARGFDRQLVNRAAEEDVMLVASDEQFA